MICPERERLAKDYQIRVEAFRDAVFGLKDLHGPDFAKGQRRCDTLHLNAQSARLALEDHRKSHLC
jgi:hypothetical protein